MKLSICIVALLCTGVVLASRRQIREVSPHFTCGPQGIKRFTNQTGPEPVVLMRCPYSVETNMTVEITCAVMSRSFALIAWLYNGEPIDKPHVKTESLSCRQKLKIKYAMTSDSGNYTCQVTNTNGSVTKACLLEVKASRRQVREASPHFTCGPQGIKRFTNQTGPEPVVSMRCPYSVETDMTVEITCAVMSRSFALITWLYNGEPIDKPHVKTESLSCHQKLKIKYAMTSDSGNYTCQVTNTNGSVTKACLLPVKGKNIQVHIEKVEIDGGRKRAFLQGSVSLTCIMFNVEYPLWKKDGQLIHSGRHVWRRNIVAHGIMFHLEIKNVTKSDEGRYECIGTNHHGMNATEEFYLETEPCPAGYFCPHNGNQAFPTEGPEPVVLMRCPYLVEMDMTVEITSEVMSTSFASIAWLYNGQPIDRSDKPHVKNESLSCHQKLKIKYAMTIDSGNYTCQVTNTNGSVTKACLLKVKEQKVATFRNRSLGTYNTNYVLLLISVLVVLKIPCF